VTTLQFRGFLVLLFMFSPGWCAFFFKEELPLIWRYFRIVFFQPLTLEVLCFVDLCI